MSTTRPYDLVVLGATGYTGKLTAEFIATNLPTDLRWAIAGRSNSKLEEVAAECKSLNPDRIQPVIEICQLEDEELNVLSKKTTVLITTIGPYSIYGEKAFRACADNGTHYLDVTGEVAWHSKMIKKYERTAKASGSIMIPQIGLDSALADILTWTLVDMIREKFSVPTAEVVMSVKMKGAPSGGTISSLLTLLDVFSLTEIAAANKPFAISPIPGPETRDPVPWTTKLFGFRSVRDLGVQTTYIMAKADVPQVQRSWGLLGGPNFYGPNFQFNEYMKTKNYLSAILMHFGLIFGVFFLVISPIRSLLKKVVTQPGFGPSKEAMGRESVEYNGIGNADVQTPNHPRAYVKAAYKGSPYQLTAVCIASAAISLLRDDHKLMGGIYTPACLGQPYIDRVHNGGFRIEKKIFEN